MNTVVDFQPGNYSKRVIYIHLSIIILICLSIAIIYWLKFLLGYRPELLWRVELFEFIHNFYGMFFIIPIIYATVIFRWKGAFITLLFSLACVLPILIYYHSPIEEILTNMLWLSIPLIIVSYLKLELTWRNKERNTYMQIEKERQSYVAQIFQMQEEERKLIAQELHDDTIQSLLAVARTQQGISKMTSEEKIIESALSVRDEIIRISEDLKKISLDLRPGILDNLGLIPALRWLVERFNKEGNIKAQMIIIGNERELPVGPDVKIFRIVQEALNNIRKHSQATEAMIQIEFQAEKMKLLIADNGKGFESNNFKNLLSGEKLGLLGIQERVRSLGGTFEIDSKPDIGTKINIEIW